VATYFTDDFSGFSIGSTWTRRWDTPAVADWAVSSGVLSADPDTSTFGGVSWNSTGDDDDVEILVKYKNADVSVRSYLAFFRGSGSAGTPTCYALSTSDTGLRVYYFNASETGTSTYSSTLADDTWYWFRVRINTNDITVKVWADDGSESSPLATLTITDDSSISGSGWLGLGASKSTHVHGFDVYGVGTDGDTAPSSAPVTKNVSHLLCLGAG
jgi:hypothetical protein